jgi:hypothetical protein
MRRFVQFFLISCFLAIPGIAQRGGGGFHGGGGGFHGGGGGFHGGMGGFHGGGFVRPGFRGGSWRGYRGGYYPGNRFGFGFSGYWPYYGSGWGYPYYGYPYYPYTAYSYAVPYSYPYYGYSYVYTGSDQPYCPQANGRPFYLIKLTYDNGAWLSQNYWYTADTLNFITVKGQQNKTPISTIDWDATFQLNGQCGLNFQLPR